MDDATKDQTPDGATPPPPNAMCFSPEARNPWALSRKSTASAMFACMCQGEVGSFTILFFFFCGVNINMQLLQRIPALDDLQASWLLLFCASPCSNHILRTVASELVNDFVGTHDAAVASCLQQLLGNPDLPATALATAYLPLAHGGFGLQSATVVDPAAHWASWADTLPVLARQLPEFTAMLLDHLARPHGAPPHVHAALETVQALQASGWHPPTWQELVHDTQPPHPPAAFLEGPVAEGGSTQQPTLYKLIVETSCSQP